MSPSEYVRQVKTLLLSGEPILADVFHEYIVLGIKAIGHNPGLEKEFGITDSQIDRGFDNKGEPPPLAVRLVLVWLSDHAENVRTTVWERLKR
jgi:hypothetical protein